MKVSHYIKQIDSMLSYVCSVIDHRRRQNVVRTSVTHSAIASRATYLFLPHFDVICDLLLNKLSATWNLFVNVMMMVGYCDADWLSSTDYRRSTIVYCFSLNKADPLISWKSRKRPTVALSSCEAEYIALSVAVLEGLCHSQEVFKLNILQGNHKVNAASRQ